MKKRHPSASEIETIARAVEGGLVDDLIVDWLFGASHRAARTAIPRFGRLVGAPLIFEGWARYPKNSRNGRPLWQPVRDALTKRYGSYLRKEISL